MNPRLLVLAALSGVGLMTFSHAQPPQVPTTQIPNKTVAKDQKATVAITSRSDAAHAGKFTVRLKLSYDPATDAYPTGAVEFEVDLTDSLQCHVVATTVEQVTSFGKHTPTVMVSGRCDVKPHGKDHPPSGCRYWVLLADNTKDPSADPLKNTPDVVSFFVEDKLGKRIAYGTGPVVSGNIILEPTN